MPETLPYLASPGSIKTCLDRIKAAATPERFTQDFVTTKLQIKGGTGAALIPFLKKIGLVASDGAPTDLYRQFRTSATSSQAIAKSIKHGYSALSSVNEYFYDLSDADFMDVILQVTGAEQGNQVAKLTLSTFKVLRSFAKFDEQVAEQTVMVSPLKQEEKQPNAGTHSGLGAEKKLNLSYTINLNLPATSDQAVFNAIFKSLKEHLFAEANE